MPEPTVPIPPQKRRVFAFLLAAAAGFAINEVATRSSGRSAVDTLGWVLAAISAGCGLVLGSVFARTRAGKRAWLAATFSLGLLASGAVHEQLNLLPFAALFVVLVAGVPFFLGASLGGRPRLENGA